MVIDVYVESRSQHSSLWAVDQVRYSFERDSRQTLRLPERPAVSPTDLYLREDGPYCPRDGSGVEEALVHESVQVGGVGSLGLSKVTCGADAVLWGAVRR